MSTRRNLEAGARTDLHGYCESLYCYLRSFDMAWHDKTRHCSCSLTKSLTRKAAEPFKRYLHQSALKPRSVYLRFWLGRFSHSSLEPHRATKTCMLYVQCGLFCMWLACDGLSQDHVLSHRPLTLLWQLYQILGF